jgi:hypothetical protein
MPAPGGDSGGATSARAGVGASKENIRARIKALAQKAPDKIDFFIKAFLLNGINTFIRIMA